jgi:hypothetical protein
MITKNFQQSFSEEYLSHKRVFFFEEFVICADIHDTLSNLSDDLDKYKIVLKKKKSPNKIGKRGFMIDNINKKLKGNFFKYIFNVFKNFGFKLKKLPQSFITNVSTRINKQFIDKPLNYIFEHYGIIIPVELSFTLPSGSVYTDMNKDDSYGKLAKTSNYKNFKRKSRSVGTSRSTQNSDNSSSELSYLKKIILEYSFEYVFDNIFLKSEYFARLIEEFKSDPRYSREYIDKFLKQAEQCMNKLKG